MVQLAVDRLEGTRDSNTDWLVYYEDGSGLYYAVTDDAELVRLGELYIADDERGTGDEAYNEWFRSLPAGVLQVVAAVIHTSDQEKHG